MADSGTNGGGSGGSSFDGKVTLEKSCNINIKNFLLPYTKERFIQECAKDLYANMNFDTSLGGMNEFIAAQKAISRAKTLARELENNHYNFISEKDLINKDEDD